MKEFRRPCGNKYSRFSFSIRVELIDSRDGSILKVFFSFGFSKVNFSIGIRGENIFGDGFRIRVR
jgi:hypothetical protein